MSQLGYILKGSPMGLSLGKVHAALKQAILKVTTLESDTREGVKKHSHGKVTCFEGINKDQQSIITKTGEKQANDPARTIIESKRKGNFQKEMVNMNTTDKGELY